MVEKTNCAVIFCGGRGSRLGMIGTKKSKSLLLVNNKPIIHNIINQILKTKINKIILPLGFKGNDIKNYVKSAFKKNISKFIFVSTGIDTEISERIIKIKKHLSPGGFTIFINGDTILNLNLNSFFKSHLINKKKISLATFSPKIDLGFVKVRNKQPVGFKKSIFISRFNIKKNNFLAYSGLMIIDTKYLQNFQFNNKTDFELEMYNKCIKSKGVNVFLIKRGTCFPIDNVKNLIYANKNLNLKN